MQSKQPGYERKYPFQKNKNSENYAKYSSKIKNENIDSLNILKSNRVSILHTLKNTTTNLKSEYTYHQQNDSRNAKGFQLRTADNNAIAYNISDLCDFIPKHDSDVESDNECEDIDEHKGLYFHKISRLNRRNTFKMLKNRISIEKGPVRCNIKESSVFLHKHPLFSRPLQAKKDDKVETTTRRVTVVNEKLTNSKCIIY